jgi:hypothetical protein
MFIVAQGLRPRDESVPITSRALHQALSTSRQVVNDFGLEEA